MIRPSHFGYNKQTAGSNAFQKEALTWHLEANIKARSEFDEFAAKLSADGISTYVFDEDNPDTPDAVFPNNWISFHESGKVVLYPMMAENRRAERRQDILYRLEKDFDVAEVLDLSIYEKDNKYLEGTGSIVFDYVNRIAYACRSPRTSEDLFNICCRELGYLPVMFNAADRHGREIYHTNVLMALGDEVCVICLDSLDDKDRPRVEEMLLNTGHEILNISFSQMEQFAGNMLQLSGNAGRKSMVMSEAAFRSLRQEQVELLESYMKPLYSDLTTIETLGGGSARCMIAGIFLPIKKRVFQ